MIDSIVILTGAGISAESGIKTFRDNDGLWEKHRIEDVATPEAFQANPALVYEFYNARRAQLFDENLSPNAAHYALAKLEQEFAGNVTLVTQNVDNLHERAGSKNVLHMHGELLSAKCTVSDKRVPWQGELNGNHRCDCCSEPKPMRPDIVWFGEMPIYMDEIYHALSQTSLFVAIGTSGNVYPAAGFVDYAYQNGAETLLINLEALSTSVFANQIIGPASNCVTNWVSTILAEQSNT